MKFDVCWGAAPDLSGVPLRGNGVAGFKVPLWILPRMQGPQMSTEAKPVHYSVHTESIQHGF